MSDPSTSTPESAAPRWRPLERTERRVAGVLAEKAKTTPENYPLSINALVNGCNQKSNRYPLVQLDEEHVSSALDSLRHSGAVSLIQGDGRVEKYRHLLYDWLGVDKAELAVMTELLLRGAQTLGELRGRAARMEPIADIGSLQPIVDRLRHKGLVIFLSAPGRGAVVTHNLYQPQELAKLKAEHAGGGNDESSDPPQAQVHRPGSIVSPPAALQAVETATANSAALDDLRTEVSSLKRELAELREHSQSMADEVRRELDDLKRQLGV